MKPMKIEEIILELRQQHRLVPVAALRAASAHRKTMTPVLLGALETVLATPDKPDEAMLQLATYGIYLLAECRDNRAFPLLCRLYGLPRAQRDTLVADMITEDAARHLAATAGESGGPAALNRAFVESTGDAHYRLALFDALISLVAWGEAKREEVAPILTRHFIFSAVQEVNPDDDFIGCAVMSALDFGLVEVRDEIRRLLRTRPSLEEFVDWEEAELQLRQGAESGWEYQRHPRFRRLGKATEECAWWHRSERE